MESLATGQEAGPLVESLENSWLIEPLIILEKPLVEWKHSEWNSSSLDETLVESLMEWSCSLLDKTLDRSWSHWGTLGL